MTAETRAPASLQVGDLAWHDRKGLCEITGIGQEGGHLVYDCVTCLGGGYWGYADQFTPAPGVVLCRKCGLWWTAEEYADAIGGSQGLDEDGYCPSCGYGGDLVRSKEA